jgi:hypothetical protein
MIGFYVLLGGIVSVVGTIVLLDWFGRRKDRRSSSSSQSPKPIA